MRSFRIASTRRGGTFKRWIVALLKRESLDRWKARRTAAYAETTASQGSSVDEWKQAPAGALFIGAILLAEFAHEKVFSANARNGSDFRLR